MNEYRVIVAHPGKQHSFQMASAVKKANMLDKYLTTVYYKPGSLTKWITDKFLTGKDLKKAHTRTCNELDNSDVEQINEWMGLVTLLTSRISGLYGFTKRWNEFTGSQFYKKSMKKARRENVDAIIVYDGYSNRHFDLLDGSGVIKIMDVSFASRQYLKKIFETEIEQFEADDLRRTSSELWNEKWMMNDLRATQKADYFFAPSIFVKRSLEYCGIESDRIYVVPYGVNSQEYNYVDVPFKNGGAGKLKLLFVGEISCRKGLHRLLEVASGFQEQIEIRLCGNIDPMTPIYQKYRNVPNIEFVGFVTRDQLVNEYSNADVFVFPTLGEGYGLVVLEALSCGLPVICSDRAGGNDIIQNGVNGFVISIDTDTELRNSIAWCLENRESLHKMRAKARESVEDMSWNTYKINVEKCLYDIMRKEHK